MTESEDEVQRVLAALENPRYKWRTVGGVVKESGLPMEVVVQVISGHSSRIVRSSVPTTQGEALFTTREHRVKTATIGEKLLGALKNRIY